MSICQTVREWLPWYVSGRLAPTRMGRLASHIASCEVCQKELACVVQLRHQYVSSMEAGPTPVDRVWKAMEPDLEAPPRQRIDVGSFLIGVNFGIAANNQKSPVHGNLKVLGHKVRIIGKQKKGA